MIQILDTTVFNKYWINGSIQNHALLAGPVRAQQVIKLFHWNLKKYSTQRNGQVGKVDGWYWLLTIQILNPPDFSSTKMSVFT